jgi:ferredoxin-NADP reductase
VGITLVDPRGRALAGWRPGAHLDLLTPQEDAQVFAVRRARGPRGSRSPCCAKPEGRGGSDWMHDKVARRRHLACARARKTHFRLDEDAQAHVLIAGGIGITPILAMADRLRALGRDYVLHYCGATRARMAFLERIQRDHGDRLVLHVSDEGTRSDPAELLAAAPKGAQVCACGPERLLDALAEAEAQAPHCRLTVEHFNPADTTLDPAREHAFTVELADSGLSVEVPADRTLLQALTLSHFLPAVHGIQTDFIEPWARGLEECSGGQVAVEIFPGGTQLGNVARQQEQVLAGVVDIAHGLHGIPRGRFNRTSIIDLPFLTESAGAATQTLWDLFPEYLEEEYEGMKVLALHAHNGGLIHTVDKPVETMEDLEGPAHPHAEPRRIDDARASGRSAAGPPPWAGL